MAARAELIPRPTAQHILTGSRMTVGNAAASGIGMLHDFEWAAHEPEAIAEGISPEIVDIIKHRKDTRRLAETDAIVIELGREIFGARKVASATFARSLRQFGRRALVDLVALMGNYAATAAVLTAFDMQLDPGQTPPLPLR